jgi:hypothetical protein
MTSRPSLGYIRDPGSKEKASSPNKSEVLGAWTSAYEFGVLWGNYRAPCNS